jgi:hypothetical protein
VEYKVQFVERRLEGIQKRLKRFERMDTKPLQAILVIADFNQRAYELFGRPLIQAISTEGDGPGFLLCRARCPVYH